MSAAALAVCAVTIMGCSAVGSIVEGLTDEGPPVDEALERESPAPTGGTSSVYVVSPAVTWEALQLHRPHSIGGSSFPAGGRFDPACQRAAHLPFEVTGLRLADPGGTLSFERPDGIRGTGAPGELPFSFDREIVSQRMMRSGAFLVQRGPVCLESFFLHFDLALGRSTGAATHW